MNNVAVDKIIVVYGRFNMNVTGPASTGSNWTSECKPSLHLGIIELCTAGIVIMALVCFAILICCFCVCFRVCKSSATSSPPPTSIPLSDLTPKPAIKPPSGHWEYGYIFARKWIED